MTNEREVLHSTGSADIIYRTRCTSRLCSTLRPYVKKKRWLSVILGCALLVGLLIGVLDGLRCGLHSCIVDWDHVWVWVLNTSSPVNLSGQASRPFHTVLSFLVQSELWNLCTIAPVSRLLAKLAVVIRPELPLDHVAYPTLVWEELLQEVVT